MLEDGDGIELVQRYDPKKDSWLVLSPMLIARSGSAACVLNNLIYVIGIDYFKNTACLPVYLTN